MKRSEMIEIITEYLATDGVINDSDLWLEDIAIDIVGLVEKAGMLPPDRALCHPDLNYKDHSWEEE